ncbi:hypothetical protein SASPL_133964 [Salvia splendens]|uniref:Uncharacterized protein n=1 Tax=Salvia splendens TaxID=180675 RepID=A0A8X8ZJM0_SALSN|nr:hypothetical protein SASPL_133964 [Salvia splendens]
MEEVIVMRVIHGQHSQQPSPSPTDVDKPEEDSLADPNSSGNRDQQTSSAKSGGSKRKAVHTDALLMDFLANLHVETNSRMEVISSRIGYDFDLGQARQAVFDKLGDVEGLTIYQRYQLCNILGDKP